MKEIEGELVWDEDPPEYLDYILAYEYSFIEEQESEGRPDIGMLINIYGWENVEYEEYDGSKDSNVQKRYYFGLNPYDFGSKDFDSSYLEDNSYLKEQGCPPSAIDFSALREEERIEYIDEFSPNFSDQDGSYKLQNIPEGVKSDSMVADSIVFSDVQDRGDCLEFMGVDGDTVTLEVNDCFSKCTLVLLAKEFDSVSLPDELSGYLAASQL